MTTSFSRVAVTSLALIATTTTLAPAAHAQSSVRENLVDSRQCVAAGNVWVYVEFGADSEKDPEGGCAIEFTDGLVALESAGFAPETIDSEYGKMLTGINGVIPVWEDNQTYWSYFTGDVAEDYSVSYDYSMVGASASQPKGGSVEAWVVGTGVERPALDTLPETPLVAGSSEQTGWITAIAGLLALIGSGVVALYQGLITIPGVVLPKF